VPALLGSWMPEENIAKGARRDGGDLSSTTDISALVLVFAPKPE